MKEKKKKKSLLSCHFIAFRRVPGMRFNWIRLESEREKVIFRLVVNIFFKKYNQSSVWMYRLFLMLRFVATNQSVKTGIYER